jgi:hypothetical protein
LKLIKKEQVSVKEEVSSVQKVNSNDDFATNSNKIIKIDYKGDTYLLNTQLLDIYGSTYVSLTQVEKTRLVIIIYQLLIINLIMKKNYLIFSILKFFHKYSPYFAFWQWIRSIVR